MALDLLIEFGMPNVLTMPIYCDNESYIKIAMNPIYHSKTKHFTIHLKYIQQFTKIERIEVICPICKTTGWHIHKSSRQKNYTMQRFVENENLKVVQQCPNSINEGTNIPSCVFPLSWGCQAIVHNTNMIFPLAPFVLFATLSRHQFISTCCLQTSLKIPGCEIFPPQAPWAITSRTPTHLGVQDKKD
jgi:hypothetical protein